MTTYSKIKNLDFVANQMQNMTDTFNKLYVLLDEIGIDELTNSMNAIITQSIKLEKDLKEASKNLQKKM